MAVFIVFNYSIGSSGRVLEPLFGTTEFQHQCKTVMVATIPVVIVIEQTEIIAYEVSFGVMSVTIIFVHLEKSHPVLLLIRINPHLQGKWSVKTQHPVGSTGIGKPHHTDTVIKQFATVELWTRSLVATAQEVEPYSFNRRACIELHTTGNHTSRLAEAALNNRIADNSACAVTVGGVGSHAIFIESSRLGCLVHVGIVGCCSRSGADCEPVAGTYETPVNLIVSWAGAHLFCCPVNMNASLVVALTDCDTSHNAAVKQA